MILLVVGLALWVVFHHLTFFAPNLRTRLGKDPRGAVSGILILSVVLMVVGYIITSFTHDGFEFFATE